MRTEKGSVGELMAVCLCLLAMTVVMLSYVDSVKLIQQKAEVGQIARKYILRMETVGMLTEEDRAALCEELAEAGITQLQLDGTTEGQAEYGNPIILQIKGKLRDQYEFTEKRVSTAKY